MSKYEYYKYDIIIDYLVDCTSGYDIFNKDTFTELVEILVDEESYALKQFLGMFISVTKGDLKRCEVESLIRIISNFQLREE